MPANSRTVALIGSETLLAREVRDIVATGGADFGLRLVAAVEEESGALTRVGDEAADAGAIGRRTGSGGDRPDVHGGGAAGRAAARAAGGDGARGRRGGAR